MTGANNDQTFTLLTEQLSRMTDELVSQRESHIALVREVSQQNVTLASLAERITAHNRLLEERKASDHMRIGGLETRMTTNEGAVADLQKWKWKVAGAASAAALLFGNVDRLISWIT